MSLGLYHHGTSWLHRRPAAWKAVGLTVVGSVSMAVQDLRWVLLLLIATVGLHAAAELPWRAGFDALRPMLWLFVVLFIVQALSTDWRAAFLVILRLAALLALASLVTMTTRVADMIDAIERGLSPLSRLGVDPAKVALAIALAIRFVPLLAEQLRDIREAQHARGKGGSVTAVAVPLIVRALKTADSVAEAIDARSFPPGA